MNGEKGDIAIDEVTFTRNQNCSFIPDFARSTYTAGKQNITIFREKVRSVLAGFHAGHLS